MRIYKSFVKKNYNMLFYVVPSLIGIAWFLLLPLLDVFVNSFQKGMSSEFVGLLNYTTVINNSAFRLATKNTIIFDVISLPLLICLSLVMAYIVVHMKSKIIRFAFLIPMTIPSNSLVTVWRMLFDDAGIVNGVLNSLGFETTSFLTGSNAMILLIGIYIWKNMGYDMLIWMTALAVIPENIYEAARIDGAGEIRMFFSITLPNIRSAAYTVTVLSFVNSFKVFREIYILSGSYPDDSIYMLQHLFNNWFSKLDISKLSAGACITAVVLFAVLGLIKIIILPRRRTDE